MPGLDERTAEAPDAVGQQHFSDGLCAAVLEEDDEPDQQRNQTEQGQETRSQPVSDFQSFVHQVVGQQIGKNHHSRHGQPQHTFAQRGDGDPDDKQQRVAQSRCPLRLIKGQQRGGHAECEQRILTDAAHIAPITGHGREQNACGPGNHFRSLETP
ncbi:hypothetical protein D3C81_1159050 [compost metagenome]